jgi:hypothetical protein
MKWDKTTNPPTAWEMEDGEWVTVNPDYVKQCEACGKWFVQNPLDIPSKLICSTGCTLKWAEFKARRT